MPLHALHHRVNRLAERLGAGATPSPTGVAGLDLVRSPQPTTMEAQIYQPIVCLVLSGAKQSCLGDRLVTFSEGEALIVGLDLPSASRIVTASPERPYLAIALALDMALLREIGAEMADDEPAGSATDGLAAGAADAALVDAMGRLFDLHESPAAARVLTASITREVHFHLLNARHGRLLRRLVHGDSHASRIARAIARIREAYATPLSVAELAGIAGMSASSFHEHFKAITQTTPLQFQKGLRLIEARRRLLAGDASVSAAAFAVGYESPTQFSRDYARRFGLPPLSDRQRGRTAAA